ncbi:MAG: hypothetical protein QM493_05225, partial [Sulfurovum sp.]
MLDNSLNEVLDDKKISEALKENSIEKFSGKKRVYIPSDHCDIRKKHSWKMENIGKVLDLDKKITNGFSTLASIISLCHIHDRFGDMSKYFEHIDQELKDEFVIRGTATRVSNQTKLNGKGNTIKVKLVDSEFANRDSQVIEKLRLKG